MTTTKSNKYQQEDNLFEDPIIPTQKFVLCSFLSPELIKNCKIRAVKAKGFFATHELAMKKKVEFEQIDNIHKIFIADVGKWSIFDIESDAILNELAGRRKEYLENSKKTHKDRVKQTIKSGIAGTNVDDIYDDDCDESSIVDTTSTKNIVNTFNSSQCTGPKEDAFFELQDDTNLSPEKQDVCSDNKKIFIDELKNDPVIEDQEFCLYSFLAPEGLMNTNVRSVKFRGGFKTKEECAKRAEFLRKVDKDYDIFIGETGRWMEQDPDPLSVKNGIYKNKKENKIMEKIHIKSYENKVNGDGDNDKEASDLKTPIPKMDPQEKKDLMKKLKQVPRKVVQQEKLKKLLESRRKERELKEGVDKVAEQSDTLPAKTRDELTEERIRINKKEEDLKKLTENAKKMNQNLENFKKTLKK